MAAISMLNPKAEIARASQALAVNMAGARGIQDVLKTNLGPKGTMKMLVGGAGDIKITKDGNVLLHEMQIQHPTASLVARASTAQDDITGDGTTSTVLLIGEFLKQADVYISEGLHPRIVTEGFEMAKNKALEVLDTIKVPLAEGDDKDTMLQAIAKTSLGTKVHPTMAEQLTPIVVEAVTAIQKPGQPIDLHMVEMMEMQHRSETESQLVRGLVLDHGGRHPDMPKRLENCFILTCNVSLEYEKTEVNSGFFYRSASSPPRGSSSRTGRCRRSVEELDESALRQAGLVYEHVLGENIYTFVEECTNPQSVTYLMKGPNKHTFMQIKDAVRDGLRAVKNTA